MNCKSVSRQLCPTRKEWMFLFWKLLMLSMIFLNLWLIFDKEALPPDGNLFHMFILFIMANFFGKISQCCHLPPLFGMLVAGFIHGNATNVELDKKLTSSIRSLALIIILIRAGLNLDPKAIRRLSLVCARLSLLPSIIEAITIALFAWLVFDLNISWSLMLGFVIGSVSPAVVVPGMVQIQEAKFGTKKGIPTLLIASASVDNVFAITGVSVCLSFVFATQNSTGTWQQTIISILRGPLEAFAGVIIGLIIGVILWYLPEKYDQSNQEQYGLHRFALLFASSLFVWFGSQSYDFKSIGPLAILTGPFVASIRWRQNNLGNFSKESLRILWIIFENFLFSLIGSSVQIKNMQTSMLLYGTICILTAVIIRMLVAFLVTYGNRFNKRERLFAAITWLPKATIQAAMGPVALDLATTTEDMDKGRLVLTLAVLSIMLTAPLGAIAIHQTYRRLLIDHNDTEQGQHLSSSHQNEVTRLISKE